MRIDLTRSRRGELGMEALLILPVALVVILLARFVMEGMLIRQEVAVYTRSATAAAAQAESVLPIHCAADRDPFSERPAVSQNALVLCREREAEQGLVTQPHFWPAIRQGAQTYPRMMRDVYQDDTVMDMQGDGAGSSAITRPAFLQRTGILTTSYSALFPQGEVWPHHDAPMQASYDPVLWDTLRERGTYRLFPNVFPARNN